MFSAGLTARKNPQGKFIRIKLTWKAIGKAVNAQLNAAIIFNRTCYFTLLGQTPLAGAQVRPFDMLRAGKASPC